MADDTLTKHYNEAARKRLFGRAKVVGDCIFYPGRAATRSGHRQIWFKGRMQLAHRVAWMLEVGPIPDGLCVLHQCDNPPCINTGHLFLGTVQENNADRDAKGRGKLPRPDQVRRLQPGPTVHGTLTAYVKRKCRCGPCRQANSAYRQGRKAQRDAMLKVAWPQVVIG
ncbi:HNH endonuclease signature motif containing protein [Nonomuraea sp. NPDC050547]|uniref:HNH endonuclease signature motif containing protein n=1 Tax=Nonomuraea sp. NPDC050547 TaxID=3364368 RepID=UPI0037A8964E